MDAIQAVRELGKAIQADERYIEYARAKKVNDEDAELQNLIGEFNLIRQNAAMEYNKPEEEQNKEKLTKLNADMQEAYEKVMANENMAMFTVAKAGMDELTPARPLSPQAAPEAARAAAAAADLGRTELTEV